MSSPTFSSLLSTCFASADFFYYIQLGPTYQNLLISIDLLHKGSPLSDVLATKLVPESVNMSYEDRLKKLSGIQFVN